MGSAPMNLTDPVAMNTITNIQLHNSSQITLYGPIQSSSISRLIFSQPFDLIVYPGQNWADVSNPVNLTVVALDAYQQVMTTGQQIAIQLQIRPIPQQQQQSQPL